VKGRSYIHSREKGALHVFHGKVYRRCNRTNITVSQVQIYHARNAYKSDLINKVTRTGSFIKAAFIRSVIKVQATRKMSAVKVKATGVGSVVEVEATRVESVVKVEATSTPVRALRSITKARFMKSIVGSDIHCPMVEKELSVGLLVSCNSLDSCSNPSEPLTVSISRRQFVWKVPVIPLNPSWAKTVQAQSQSLPANWKTRGCPSVILFDHCS
jgi:hypothetical protein